jgi:hypothetical protein
MSISHDNLPDRFLRYAPWTAAALVGVCVVALVARVVSKASSTNEPPEIVTTSGEPEAGRQKEPVKPTHVAPRPELASVSKESGKSLSNQARPAVGARTSAAARGPLSPQTPSAKSRLEMHTARRGNPEDEPQRKVTTKAQSRTFIASSRSVSADVQSDAVGA